MGNTLDPLDRWAEGKAYEPYVGRWSRLVARELIDWLALPKGARWLDVGCGTGAVTRTILEAAGPREVKGIDRSAGYVAFAQALIVDERAHFEVGDAQELQVETEAFDAAVSGLMLNFLPRPDQAVMGMRRAVRPGGVVAAYVWDYAGKMQFMRHFWNSAVALDPDAYELDEGRRFPLCKPEPLADLYRSAGLRDVEVLAIDIPTDFTNFHDFWTPFLGGQGPAPGYVLSLSEDRREALRERIRLGLPFALDGSIPLVARAWAVRGVS